MADIRTTGDQMIDNLLYVHYRAHAASVRLQKAREALYEIDSADADPRLLTMVQELLDASVDAGTALTAAAAATQPDVIGAFRALAN